MEWNVYNRAKNLESWMKIIKDTLDGKIAVDDKIKLYKEGYRKAKEN